MCSAELCAITQLEPLCLIFDAENLDIQKITKAAISDGLSDLHQHVARLS